jgi:DNA repair photolyase
MHSAKHDELYFATQYVAGLKDEIKAIVEPQIPLTVDRAALIAKIQQKVVDRNKQKYQRHNPAFKQQQHKTEVKQPNPVGSLWRDRQLWDYRKANNLCFHCGEKFEPGHLEVCAKKEQATDKCFSGQ